MSERVRRVEYYYATVDDKPGEAQRLLEFLSAHGINLVGFTAFPAGDGKSQLDFIPENVRKLREAVGEAGVSLTGPKNALLIQGDDRTGVLVEYHLRLADSGVNVYAANGVSDSEGRFGYILWVRPEDFEKAAEALDA